MFKIICILEAKKELTENRIDETNEYCQHREYTLSDCGTLS